MASETPTIVLVHGAWADATGFDPQIRALRDRDPQSMTLRRYEEVGRMLTGRSGATPEDGISWAHDICAEFEIPPLDVYGVREQDVAALVEEGARTSSMKGNPLVLTPEELRDALLRSIKGRHESVF